VFRWPAHEARLRRSARGIGLDFKMSSSRLLSAVQKVLRANRSPESTIRLCLSRGEGPLGLDPSACGQPTFVVLPHSPRRLHKMRARGVSIALVDVRRIPQSCLNPEVKSASALPLVLAKAQSQRRGAFEGVLLNTAGYLAEGTVSNLFFIRRGELHTPSLRCGILDGITRGVLLGLAKKIKMAVSQGRYRPRDLNHADEIFLSNSSWEVMPVVRFHDGRRWRAVSRGRPGPRTLELHRLFRRSVERETRSLLL
jgi:branched-chain amino acid aminotransferase